MNVIFNIKLPLKTSIAPIQKRLSRSPEDPDVIGIFFLYKETCSQRQRLRKLHTLRKLKKK